MQFIWYVPVGKKKGEIKASEMQLCGPEVIADII